MKKIQGIFPVVYNKPISGRYWHMKIDAPDIAKATRPGQFIHIRVTQGLEPFFRRPFSVYRYAKYVEIFYDVVGKGTRVLASRKPGDVVDVMGPLGASFTLPSKKIKNVVMIAGGVGVAPFLAMTDALKNKDQDLVLLYGGRVKEQTFSMKEFRANGCRVCVATDDGSVGQKGRVSLLFDRIKSAQEETFIYTCGPRPMIASVQKWAREKGYQGEASLEEVMACGLGACLGCATKTVNGYKTVCHDGPVFDLKEILL